jgi:Domain of unknown function (DUF1972)
VNSNNTKPTKIALLGTHGLPAQHGAFEQTVHKLCEISLERGLKVNFLVGSNLDYKNNRVEMSNVTRVFAVRPKGLGILIYDLITSLKAYTKGARTFVYFGYEFAPFFIFFRLIGVKIICNVDGIEWRREKWGRWPKAYFRLCEWMSARTASTLIFDAHGIDRYFRINHRSKGVLIFYGSDPLPDTPSASEYEPGSYYSLVMRMEPENNIKPIIEGFNLANTSRPLLLIGPSTPFFDRECRPLIDGEKIRYLGPIYDRDRLINIRRHSHAYIHGHSVGGTNPTLIEAIGLRNRIIAYNSIFNREVCGDKARYFSNMHDLARIVENNDLPPPPILGSAYEWESVAQSYFEICGIV